MARSNSVANILFQHVSWETDSLIIQFAQHKGDKEGQVKFGRHVYANPREPTICPILSIAVLIFSKNRRAAGGRQRWCHKAGGYLKCQCEEPGNCGISVYHLQEFNLFGDS